MKRVVSTETITSGFSFDFVWEDGYDQEAIENAIYTVFEDMFDCEVIGIDFHSVDYSGYPEYNDKFVSQCSLDFRWSDDYDDKGIADAMKEEIAPAGYDMIGYEFYSLID